MLVPAGRTFFQAVTRNELKESDAVPVIPNQALAPRVRQWGGLLLRALVVENIPYLTVSVYHDEQSRHGVFAAFRVVSSALDAGSDATDVATYLSPLPPILFSGNIEDAFVVSPETDLSQIPDEMAFRIVIGALWTCFFSEEQAGETLSWIRENYPNTAGDEKLQTLSISIFENAIQAHIDGVPDQLNEYIERSMNQLTEYLYSQLSFAGLMQELEEEFFGKA